MLKNKFIVLILVMVVMVLSSCQPQEAVLSEWGFALDTVIEIKLYYSDSKEADENLIGETFTLISELENILSVHIEESELYAIKENAGISPVEVSDITYSVISDSIEYSNLTNGLFDITSGPLIDLWDIDPPNGYVPTDEELEEVLKLVDYNKIDLSNDNEVYLMDEGMIINLGAIAKGRIADEAKNYLIENGVTSAYLNLGGNVLLIGEKPDGSSFEVGVQDPFDDRGAYLMAISSNDNAVVTSGDYERYFEYEGVIYHHILSTDTGYPSDTNIKQVSIVAPTSQMADALSTSVLLLGIEDGLELINSIDNVEAVFVTKDKMVYITENLRGRITYDNNQMSEFTVTENLLDLYK